MMRRSPAIVVLVALLLSALISRRSVAGVPLETHAVAEALFREASEAFARGDVETALARFTGSNQLEPGPGKRFNIATCHARLHHAASAWVLFRDVALDYERAGDGERAAIARAKANEVDGLVSYLKVVVPKPVPGLRVTLADVTVPMEAWGIDVPVDAGPYEVRAVAPQYIEWIDTGVTIEDSQHVVVTVPELKPLPMASSVARPPKTLRTLAWVGLGGGGAAVAVGALTGGVALSDWDKAKNRGCSASPPVCPSSAGAGYVPTANAFALASDVAFVGAGVLLATGLTLLFLSPQEKARPVSANVRVVVGPGGVMLSGKL
jgi:hypothetical protein